ncbi:MAG: hypothetical protein U0Y68_09365 [Blastocatellia bacterium]
MFMPNCKSIYPTHLIFFMLLMVAAAFAQEANVKLYQSNDGTISGVKINIEPPIPGLTLQYACNVGGREFVVNEGGVCGSTFPQGALRGLAVRLGGSLTNDFTVSYQVTPFGQHSVTGVNGTWTGVQPPGAGGQFFRIENIRVWLTCDACTLYSGEMSTDRGSVIQPNGRTFYYNGGTPLWGFLQGPAGTDFDLYLERWNGAQWVTMASSTGSTPNEKVLYTGALGGYYRWKIVSYNGTGSFNFWFRSPRDVTIN